MAFNFYFTILLLSVSIAQAFGNDYTSINAEEARHRAKRAPGDLLETVVLTEAEKIEIVRLHNQYRSRANASDMLAMSWDNTIAQFASNYISNCDFAHSTNAQRSSISGFSIIGENLGTQITSSNIRSRDYILSVTQAWHNEINDYFYDTFSCIANKACGHYTQVVWAKTYKIGCGAAFCRRATSTVGYRLLVSCNYGPAGNFLNNTAQPSRVGRPFERKGAPCSQCAQQDTCVD
uniref:SCP domain-containing protein n=1 Tax=Ciona savignyi TaxID=51511 RepID=H2Z9A1_CIOSA